MMDNRYYVRSNREAGEGRFDIQLMPKVKTLPGILIELKAAKKADRSELKTLAAAALSQIYDRKYDAEMISLGINDIIKYGVAFCGKEVEILAV